MTAPTLDDPRFVRTRAALLTALLGMRDDEVAAVSVGSLTRSAGVHRTSFYNHFSSLPEAAAAALGTGMHEIMDGDTSARRAGAPPESVAVTTSERTLAYLASHRGLYLLASDWRSPSGLRGIADVLARQLREYRAQFGADQAARADLDAEDVYVASAVEGFYAAVLLGGLPLDGVTASRVLYELFPAWMRSPSS